MTKFLVLFVLVSFSAFAADPDVVVFSFQKQKNPEELKTATQAMGEYLSKKIDKKVEIVVPTSYGATAQGLISDKVHIAYMDSLPYLLAAAEVPLEILVVEKRNGKTNYDSLIVVAKESPILKLKDLKGKKIAFSSQTSTSGFLFPFYRLVEEKQVKNQGDLSQYFSQVLYAGGYDKALLAAANGQVDAAAMSDYAFEGPKADLYGTTEIRNKLRILARTSGVPTHLVVASKKISAALAQKIQAALLALAKDKPELLSSVYGAAEFSKPDKKHVEKTKMALESTGLSAQSFVK